MQGECTGRREIIVMVVESVGKSDRASQESFPIGEDASCVRSTVKHEMESECEERLNHHDRFWQG